MCLANKNTKTTKVVCTARVGAIEVGNVATRVVLLKGKSAARELKRVMHWLDNMIW